MSKRRPLNNGLRFRTRFSFRCVFPCQMSKSMLLSRSYLPTGHHRMNRQTTTKNLTEKASEKSSPLRHNVLCAQNCSSFCVEQMPYHFSDAVQFLCGVFTPKSMHVRHELSLERGVLVCPCTFVFHNGVVHYLSI